MLKFTLKKLYSTNVDLLYHRLLNNMLAIAIANLDKYNFTFELRF